MNLVLFIAYSLAVYRLSNLLVYEEGPWDIFGKIRDWSGIAYDAYSQPITDNLLSKILICIKCTSVWVSILLWLLYLINIEVFTAVSFVLGASAITAILNQRL